MMLKINGTDGIELAGFEDASFGHAMQCPLTSYVFGGYSEHVEVRIMRDVAVNSRAALTSEHARGTGRLDTFAEDTWCVHTCWLRTRPTLKH